MPQDQEPFSALKSKKLKCLEALEPNPESLEAVVAADPDGDGQITYDEFKNFCIEAGDRLLTLLGL